MTQKISPEVFVSAARIASEMRSRSACEIIATPHQLPDAPPPPNEPPPPENPPPSEKPPPPEKPPDEPQDDDPGMGVHRASQKPCWRRRAIMPSRCRSRVTIAKMI